MSKTYFIIISLLIALPVLGSAVAVTYVFFKTSKLAGFIALALCLIILVAAIIFLAVKIKKAKDDNIRS